MAADGARNYKFNTLPETNNGSLESCISWFIIFMSQRIFVDLVYKVAKSCYGIKTCEISLYELPGINAMTKWKNAVCPLLMHWSYCCLALSHLMRVPVSMYNHIYSIFEGFLQNCDVSSMVGDTTVLLTHWGRDKMDAVSQTTFSNAFSSMKIVVF